MARYIKLPISLAVIGAIFILFTLGSFVWGFASDYIDTYITNKHEYNIQKIEDNTNYDTLKTVEETARSMISSYEYDLSVYEQYKDSEDKERQGWAEQSKMRANRTASSYNNYLLENSFVWKDNIPSDIKTELPMID